MVFKKSKKYFWAFVLFFLGGGGEKGVWVVVLLDWISSN